MNENGSIALKPFNMSFGEAASVVDGATTALFFLKEKVNIQNGQKVLINGASGSIGTFAVQLAKHFGAEVTGICSTKNIDLVKSLGADKVIDYTKDDFTRTGNTYDVIFDTVGKASFKDCRKVLRARGKFIATKMTPVLIFQSILRKFGNSKKVIVAMSLNKTDALNYLRSLIEEGKLITVIDRQYLFNELPSAHEYVEKGHKKGNVVISLTT